jgi:hypothetical protein
MGNGKRSGSLSRNFGSPSRKKSPFGPQNISERSTLYQLHDDEVDGTFLAPVEDRHNIGVIEVSGSLRLSPEALDERLVVGVLLVENLDCHGPIERAISCTPHISHSAAGDVGDQFVAFGKNVVWFKHVWLKV